MNQIVNILRKPFRKKETRWLKQPKRFINEKSLITHYSQYAGTFAKKKLNVKLTPPVIRSKIFNNSAHKRGYLKHLIQLRYR